MGENDKTKKDFSDILEQGAKEDDIFKDIPVPSGTDPFVASQSNTPTAAEEPISENLNIELPVIESIAGENSASTEFSITQPTASMESTMNMEVTPSPTPSIFDNDQQISLNRKFAAIESLFHLVTKECSFTEMMNEILQITIEQIPSEAGSLIEQDYQNQCLFFRAVSGKSSESLLSVTIPLGYGVVGFVCENQRPMVLSHVEDNQKYLRSISDSIGFEAKNVMVYPIVIRGRIFGCLELLNRLGEAVFSEVDQEVLATICEHAARVIENRLILALLSAPLKREAA